MVRTQIQLTEEQAKVLKKLAAAQHKSMADIIRQSVDELIKSRRTADSEERRERAIRVAGRFRSGLSNISADHDKYLSEAFSE